MTQALRDLVRAHNKDSEFPYLDFVGAFLLMEKWIRNTGGERMRRLFEANVDDLLGLPLGDSQDDLKLGYVMGLIRSHGLEVFESMYQGQTLTMH